MQVARDELLRVDGEVNVTAVALRHGFAHLGRFSAQYQAAFGEPPSATLRRGRAQLHSAKLKGRDSSKSPAMTDAAARNLSQDTDILVVGAGPTGLMLANQLARRGLKPLIIDRHAGPAEQTRAMAVQARTMEIYAKMGVIDEALARGAVAGAANMWANGRWTARVPIGDIGRRSQPVSVRPDARTGRERADTRRRIGQPWRRDRTGTRS